MTLENWVNYAHEIIDQKVKYAPFKVGPYGAVKLLAYTYSTQGQGFALSGPELALATNINTLNAYRRLKDFVAWGLITRELQTGGKKREYYIYTLVIRGEEI